MQEIGKEAIFIKEKKIITDIDPFLIDQATVINALNECIQLHDAQVVIMRSVFLDGKLVVFVECGRKLGKTEVMMYFLSRIAMTVPNAAVYYIAPFLKQAGEILWHPGRLKNFYPQSVKDKFGIRPRNTDYRIMFDHNGSFIKLDGADNYEAYRGVNPHGAGYEEFKDHHPEFHNAMGPNFATFKAPLLIIGTPPESEDNQFCEMADYAMEAEDEAWFNFPTWANPHIDRAWLKKERDKLFKTGKKDIWFREYCAKRVKSGRKHIFGRFDPKHHVVKYSILMNLIERSRKDWAFYCTCDPASASTFAVLFTAINKYNKKVLHLNEIYEEIPANMATKKIISKIVPIIDEIHGWMEDWTFTYDEAATWFSNEVLDNYGDIYPDMNFQPTEKARFKKDAGITLINDQINNNKFLMSDKCIKFKFEMNNYIKDAKGKVPVIHDHLIDDARYTNGADNYILVESKPDPLEDFDTRKRGFSPEQDFIEENGKDNYEDMVIGALGVGFE